MAGNLPKGPILKKHSVCAVHVHTPLPEPGLCLACPELVCRISLLPLTGRGGTSVPPTLAIFTQNHSIPTETVWLQQTLLPEVSLTT